MASTGMASTDRAVYIELEDGKEKSNNNTKCDWCRNTCKNRCKNRCRLRWIYIPIVCVSLILPGIVGGPLWISMCPVGSYGPVVPVVPGMTYLLIRLKYRQRNTSYLECILIDLIRTYTVEVIIVGVQLLLVSQSVSQWTDPTCYSGKAFVYFFLLLPVKAVCLQVFVVIIVLLAWKLCLGSVKIVFRCINGDFDIAARVRALYIKLVKCNCNSEEDERTCVWILILLYFLNLVASGFLLYLVCPKESYGPVVPIIQGLLCLIFLRPRYRERDTSYLDYIVIAVLFIIQFGLMIVGFLLGLGYPNTDPMCYLGNAFKFTNFSIPALVIVIPLFVWKLGLVQWFSTFLYQRHNYT